jgi:hypothetical protein
LKTASAPAQTTTPATSSAFEAQPKSQITRAVTSSSVQSAEEKHDLPASAASENGQVTAEYLTQTLTVSSTFTVVSASGISTSSVTAWEIMSGSVSSPSGTFSSASPVYPKEHAPDTKIVGGSSVEGFLSSSSSLDRSGSTGAESASSETSLMGVPQASNTATQTLSSASLATGVSQVNSTSLVLGASQTSTISSSKPVLYTGAASSCHWSLSLIFGSIIAFAMIISS